MDTDYTVVIDTKSHTLTYRDGQRTLHFEIDGQARPIVVHLHEYVDASRPNQKVLLTDTDMRTVVPRINGYFMKSRIQAKVNFVESPRTVRSARKKGRRNGRR
jgi:hypothetical protein